MDLRELFLNCGSHKESYGASALQYRGAETAQASMAPASWGNDAWDRVVEHGLTLLWCLSETLCPGIAVDGILTALRYFYGERPACSMWRGAIRRGR